MTEQDSAGIVRHLARNYPPPHEEVPRVFTALVFLLGLDDTAEHVEEFGRKCGLTVFAHVARRPNNAAA